MTPRPNAPAAQDFPDYMRALVTSAGYDNVAALARAAGMNPTNLGRWIDGKANPSIDALRKIAPMVNVRLGDLMIRAGLATREELGTVGAPPPPGPPIPAVLRRILSRLAGPALTEHQKLVLITHIQRALDMFDDLIQPPPTEPQTRKRRP